MALLTIVMGCDYLSAHGECTTNQQSATQHVSATPFETRRQHLTMSRLIAGTQNPQLPQILLDNPGNMKSA
jgi:hypothetical protein